MKEEIISFLTNDRTYIKGRELYFKYGNNMSFKKSLNFSPENKAILETLLYELGKMAGLTNIAIKNLISAPLVISARPKSTTVEKEEKPVSVQLTPDVVSGMKLRMDYSFLNDDSCPQELKILVADKISSFYKYKAAHAELFNDTNDEEILKSSLDVVKNVILNDQIKKELDYYKENKEILGEHPIFKLSGIREKYAASSIPELVKARDNAVKYISKMEGIIKENKVPDKLKANQEKLELKKQELEVLNLLLGFKNE